MNSHLQDRDSQNVSLHGKSISTAALAGVLLLTAAVSSEAGGLYRNGIGARAMALGGADAAWADDALGGLANNPAALGFLTSPSFNLGVAAGYGLGDFKNALNTNGKMDQLGAAPEIAFAMPFCSDRFVAAIGAYPEMMRDADWTYVDSIYGKRRHDAEIVLIRSAASVGMKLGDKWSLGASLGVQYNRNGLNAAYTFQSNPTLAGAKTMLDLDTEGFGVDGQFGVMFRPTENLQFGLTYKLPVTVRSEGSATGFVGTPAFSYQYDADVENHFPQRIAAGMSWKIVPQVRVAVQAEYVQWSSAFKRLPVRLRNGNNAVLNAILGSTSLNDSVPLNWNDELVARLGVEYTLSEHWQLRAGYCWTSNPLSDGTMTPMTAAITQHTLSAGFGYQTGKWEWDFAYQWDLPASETTGTSRLLSGEYSGSKTEVSAHWLGLTATYRF